MHKFSESAGSMRLECAGKTENEAIFYLSQGGRHLASIIQTREEVLLDFLRGRIYRLKGTVEHLVSYLKQEGKELSYMLLESDMYYHCAVAWLEKKLDGYDGENQEGVAAFLEWFKEQEPDDVVDWSAVNHASGLHLSESEYSELFGGDFWIEACDFPLFSKDLDAFQDFFVEAYEAGHKRPNMTAFDNSIPNFDPRDAWDAFIYMVDSYVDMDRAIMGLGKTFEGDDAKSEMWQELMALIPRIQTTPTNIALRKVSSIGHSPERAMRFLLLANKWLEEPIWDGYMDYYGPHGLTFGEVFTFCSSDDEALHKWLEYNLNCRKVAFHLVQHLLGIGDPPPVYAAAVHTFAAQIQPLRKKKGVTQ